IEITQNHHILVIDTEGLGSTELNKNQDSIIILLSLLLASYFIYNSIGVIDENSLNDLGYLFKL
ncbi:MAG: hypothetical protein ACK56I_25150, partial [bacterium]